MKKTGFDEWKCLNALVIVDCLAFVMMLIAYLVKSPELKLYVGTFIGAGVATGVVLMQITITPMKVPLKAPRADGKGQHVDTYG